MHGTIENSAIEKNKDGATVLLLQVTISDPDDVQSVELMESAGEKTYPMPGDKVAIMAPDESSKIGVSLSDNIEPDPARKEGEKVLYSRDIDGLRAAFMHLLQNGVIELNGNADFAVRFSALETAFNELKDKYNSHTHTYSPGPSPAAPTPPPNEPSTADISTAKVDKVLLP
jgi:hypothetical protein